MPDREKVRQGVWQCLLDKTEEEYETQCLDCPYYSEGISLRECKTQLRKDFCELLKKQEHKDRMFHALEDDWKRLKELLKEQEAVKPVRDEQTGRIWLCGNCGSYVGFEDNDPHDPNEFDKYCRECGKPVLWEGR